MGWDGGGGGRGGEGSEAPTLGRARLPGTDTPLPGHLGGESLFLLLYDAVFAGAGALCLPWGAPLSLCRLLRCPAFGEAAWRAQALNHG